ncbi:aromatic ring-hydroxylating dioxygenase subunit alpha [Paraburkholderia bannensis]|uniref:aromatic ring-hydroxylating dioxygenase subunit alpha n=1 Tax=Paraburkholderia bannensis TaxID=765414 RepID=UPI002AC34DE1|nr:aromatic ring-hydroxylating dioxygenase subunit alpha [Paraburkholderia bannensis]
METSIEKISDAARDALIWNDWHPVAALDGLRAGRTRLLGVELHVEPGVGSSDGLRVTRLDRGTPCHARARHGVVWACLGEPRADIVAIPETSEPDRRLLHAGAFRVHVSGLRAVENFLDMGHFPFVHTGYLGVEPYTEVAPYRIEHDEANDELYARDCRFYQPRAAMTADAALDVQYVYRVARPYIAVLYKTCPPQPARFDVIALFVQPLDEEWCVAHTVMSYLDDASPDEALRGFQQTIFAQDIKILVNQVPKRLPLTAGSEHPVRADAMSVAYRRWLRARGVTYGTTGGTTGGTTDGSTASPAQGAQHG